MAAKHFKGTACYGALRVHAIRKSFNVNGQTGFSGRSDYMGLSLRFHAALLSCSTGITLIVPSSRTTVIVRQHVPTQPVVTGWHNLPSKLGIGKMPQLRFGCVVEQEKLALVEVPKCHAACWVGTPGEHRLLDEAWLEV